jgi:hypothetical protein
MLQAKFALFAAGATLSLSASAGFVQYNFSDTSFSDGGMLNGYIVQNTDDKAIAFFDLSVTGGTLDAARFFPSGVTSNITAADTNFLGAGPTNFSVFNDQDVMIYFLDVRFGTTTTAGTYRVSGTSSQSARFPGFESGGRSIASGFAVAGAVEANLLRYLETGPIPEINYIVPRYSPAPHQVPEPGSLALLALGVAGMLAARSRKKATA